MLAVLLADPAGRCWSHRRRDRPSFRPSAPAFRRSTNCVEDRPLDIDALGAEADLAAVGEAPSASCPRSPCRDRRRRRRSPAFLPPSSNDTCRMSAAPPCMIARRCAVSPVKVMPSTSGCWVRNSPAESRAEAVHDVVDALRARRPRSSPRRAGSRSSGVSSDGLTTTVLPQASAGPTFQVISSSGRFHGRDDRDDAPRPADAVVQRACPSGVVHPEGLGGDAPDDVGEHLEVGGAARNVDVGGEPSTACRCRGPRPRGSRRTGS